MSSILARLARQDEVQKTTNDQLAALVAALMAPDGQTSRPHQIRRRLLNTNPTATGGDHISNDSEPNKTLLADAPPVGSDLATIGEIAELKLSFQQMSEKIHQATSAAPQIESVLAATSRTPFTSALTKPRQHAPSDKNGRKDGYMYVVNENNVPVSTLVVRREGWNKWEEAPKGNGEEDSSADEEKPAYRMRIEVILSQQTFSSDDENDDPPVLEDLRDVLKRKLESEDRSSSKRSDLRTTLDARKFRRISTDDPDPNERLNGDLRDKLNAGICDLRIRLNHSKSTDL
ncbi:hypothetical protein IGI04_035834 [Brassica rapa subsp. trilocularis]|uniref:Uncharacterized protein n=1 Tax=Brassica rapa subsp. trilocularis TaxID=1813537 RepID=A0ABQ7LCP3_BRACM|nr:hypothetical protein IGI04_035834 [Brassica rapa subsp. trilocularis]